MTTLGVETSSARGGVALWGGGLSASLMMDAPLHHAEELLDLVGRLLARCGIERGGIDRIAVNRGPGSFTGLRIGLATAKGICQALGIPLVGIDGTVARRAGLEDAKARVCVILPNRRDLYYVRWFSGKRAQGPVEILPEETVAARLRDDSRPTWAIGEGAEDLRDVLAPLAGVHVAPEEMNAPLPLLIAALGEEQVEKDELYELEPAYVEPVLYQKMRQR